MAHYSKRRLAASILQDSLASERCYLPKQVPGLANIRGISPLDARGCKG